MENTRNKKHTKNKDEGNIELPFGLFLLLSMIVFTSYLSINKKLISKHEKYIANEIGDE